MEHLVNIKRTWLTVQRMQETSSLIPIPHLQWATTLDLERQLDYAQAQGFHTLTLNLQMWKRQGWDTVAAGIPIIRERAPDLRLLITGVAGLKRLAELVEAFPNASFTNTTAHYLAQRYLRLRRDGTRLIKEPVEGHPDLILAENVRLFREFLAGQRGDSSQAAPGSTQPRPSMSPVAATLQREFGFEASAALDAEDLLAVDEAILDAFRSGWTRGSWTGTSRARSPPGPVQTACPTRPWANSWTPGRTPWMPSCTWLTWPSGWTRRSRSSSAKLDTEAERWVGPRAPRRDEGRPPIRFPCLLPPLCVRFRSEWREQHGASDHSCPCRSKPK